MVKARGARKNRRVSGLLIAGFGALQHPAIRQKLSEFGVDPMPLTSEQFEALVRREIETNTQLVKSAGIKVN